MVSVRRGGHLSPVILASCLDMQSWDLFGGGWGGQFVIDGLDVPGALHGRYQKLIECNTKKRGCVLTNEQPVRLFRTSWRHYCLSDRCSSPASC